MEWEGWLPTVAEGYVCIVADDQWDGLARVWLAFNWRVVAMKDVACLSENKGVDVLPSAAVVAQDQGDDGEVH